jgi:small conductance mechanosensitive channel
MVGIILAVSFFAKQSIDLFIRKSIRKAVKGTKHKSKVEEQQREDTLINLASGVASLFYWPIVALLVIAQLGVNIAPLIAGAGVIGLAIGFGAQTMVKDIIAGLFIIAENQYRVGDVVQFDNETIGKVESLSLRVTVLRDLDGVEHHVPNGSITITSNYSKEFSGINLDIGVAYESDLEKVITVINKVGDELAKDKDWGDLILEKPKFLRVENFGDNSVDLKITGTVKPLKQWSVTGELRKRIKIAFDKANIEIPFPQRVIHKSKD